VQLSQIRKLVTDSTADEWEVTRHGPFFLPKLSTSWSPGVDGETVTHIDADEHSYLLVFRPDVNLRLAWGLEEDSDLVFEWGKFPDPKISRLLVDTFWAGALVDREAVYAVDGNRCYLPETERALVQKGADTMDIETFAFTAAPDVVKRARLINRLTGATDASFDSYMKLANFIVLPD